MANTLDRIKGITAQIAVLDSQIKQSSEEMSMLEHIDDDAQRDASVTDNYEDRAEAKMTRSDVARMSKQIANLEKDRSRLVTKRDKLIAKLASM
jgi:hypothetical protein